MSRKETKAIFPGSFDPFTVGHESIVLRGLSMFDKVVVAVGVNNEKHGYFAVDKRIMLIEKVFEGVENVEVASYEGLTVDYARQIGATHILRGLRTSSDFEFERAIALTNKQISGIDTAFLLTAPEHMHVSSSVIRDIMRYGGDVSAFLPERIRDLVK
ncbi:MAG: pantetheine-phosphate adenylyltransferase [Bacteroidales bacterium]|nr:pantetheine-phosphate adenylyltransferase [Bacteroidales bacterium]